MWNCFWYVNAGSACVSSKINWRRRSMRRDDHLFSFFILTLLRLNGLGARARGAKCSQTSMYRGNFLELVHTSDGIRSIVGIGSARVRNRKRNRKFDGIGVRRIKRVSGFFFGFRFRFCRFCRADSHQIRTFFRFRLRFHCIRILIMRPVMKAVVSKPPLSQLHFY